MVNTKAKTQEVAQEDAAKICQGRPIPSSQIEDDVNRAIKLTQLKELARFVEGILGECEIKEKKPCRRT